MKRMTTWLLSLSLLGSLLLIGCSTKTVQPQAIPETAQVPQTVTLNLGTEPPTLDSVKTTGGGSFTILQQTHEGLVRLGANGEVVKGSGAAKDWTISSDGLTYTFVLKAGLIWSDGQPLTAKDFAYAWLRALDPKTGARYGSMLHAIKGGKPFNTLPLKTLDQAQYEALKKQVAINTPDDQTLTVTLDKPLPWFLALTAFPTFLPQRQDVIEKWGDKYAADADKMVYNGPFVLSNWQHEAEITLVKNPRYWDAASVKLQTATLKMVVDSNTAVNMFEANQLDSVSVPGPSLPQYEGKPGFWQMAKPLTWYLAANTGNAKLPVGNAHIRRAISLAIDRGTFVSAVLKDGSVPASGLVPDTMHLGQGLYRKQAGDVIATKADKTAAQAELAAGLKELGLEKLPSIELLIPANDLFKTYAQGIQGMIQAALPGVTMKVEAMEYKVVQDLVGRGAFELVFTGWQGDYDDPMTFLDMWVTSGPHNDAKWSNKQYDALIQEAGTSMDPTKRLAAFQQAEKLLAQELPVVPLWFPAVAGVDKPWLKGMVRFGMGAGFDLKYVTVDAKK